MDALSGPQELLDLEASIDAWLAEQLDTNPVVAGVERGEPDERRWYVRILGEEKDVYSIWFSLGQRTLSYETYFMPDPVENREACLTNLLRRNARLFGLAFSIGAEDAIFLKGQLANRAVEAEELDRILGTIYATVELSFLSAIRIGFASRFS